MEEALEGGRGPPWAVAPLEREYGNVMIALAVVGTLCTSGPFSLQSETRTGF
jgi:hypothetical protein